MLKLKTAQDFTDVGMRRLKEALESRQRSIGAAYAHLQAINMSDPHAGIQNIDGALEQLLTESLGNDWQNYITGSVL